jgi:hypothetical protein
MHRVSRLVNQMNGSSSPSSILMVAAETKSTASSGRLLEGQVAIITGSGQGNHINTTIE